MKGEKRAQVNLERGRASFERVGNVSKIGVSCMIAL